MSLQPSIDLAELANAARRIIQESDFSKRKRAVLHQIVRWSFERGREWAAFESLDDLVKLTGIHKPDVSNAIAELQRSGMLHVRRARSSKLLGISPSVEIRFLPHGALAPAPLTIDGAAAAEVCAKLELLNAPNADARMVEPSGQKRLPLPPAAEEAVEDELAANSARAAVSETLTPRPARSPAPQAATRAQHEHVPFATRKHEHDHVHAPSLGRSEEGELSPAHADLLTQIEELTETEGRSEHFRVTWIKRLSDWEMPVFRAIGEVRRMKREGQIRRSVGGALNWHFQKFRESAKRAASVVRCFFA
jgi:hypothetical protein